MKYIVLFSPRADLDMIKLESFIRDELKMYYTAADYMERLNHAIEQLSSYAGSVAISQSAYIRSRYGARARRINFEKMAVIYVVYKNYAYIKRVIPGAVIPY